MHYRSQSAIPGRGEALAACANPRLIDQDAAVVRGLTAGCGRRAPKDEPWLFDLKKDPDEVRNFYDDPAYKDVSRDLARELLAYGEKYNDPRVRHAEIRAQLKARASA